MGKEKRIGTLTFHTAHNYGAVLQAYALTKAVENLGCKCEVIHYCLPYIYTWWHIERFPELCDRSGFVGGILRYIKRYLEGVYNPKLKKTKFEHFIYNRLPLSEKAYHSIDEMNNMDYDAILFGSDQIWNSKLTGGIENVYVGGFQCLDKTKKIAYAASCGRSEFLKEEKENYYPLLQSFHALGIRENGLCASLCDDGFEAVQVLDPTLLLTKEKWNEMIKASNSKHAVKIPSKDYLLVYVFDEDESIYGLIDRVASKYNLEVCVIAYEMKEIISKYKVYQNCGPEDFVRLFAGASRIVTTSFHGTAFSIIYEKEFYCVPHPTLHERTDSLLSVLNLSNRNCSAETEIETMENIDWKGTKQKLGVLRENSVQFLKDAIE